MVDVCCADDAVTAVQDFNRFCADRFGAYPAETEAGRTARLAVVLSGLGVQPLADVLAAMSTIQAVLDPRAALPVRLRTVRTGDLCAIASRQSLLYAQERGWGRGLEINEAETVAAFLRGFKPGREQGWIAELGAAMAGAVLLTDEGGGIARLRLLHVEAFARRRGIGRLLVEACVGFARAAGYDGMTLWTHTELTDARHIYQAQGFQRVATAMHETFGVPVQGETWRLDLCKA